MNESALEFRTLTGDDSRIAEVVALHLASLPDDVLPALGSAFLQAYYRRVVEGVWARVPDTNPENGV